MNRLPITVISGYLGAGKTTLINRLLTQTEGRAITVLVNDFGAINIDAALIDTADENMIALTNGCVCCTMGNDLFDALNQVLDRDTRPDHIIVEASGIADPAAIAQAAIAEPELIYSGIVTLVDALNIPSLLADPAIAPQVEQQIRNADLVLVTKTDAITEELRDTLRALTPRAPELADNTRLSALIFDLIPHPRGRSTAPHPAYVSWQHDSDQMIGRSDIGTLLERRPPGMYRLKGFVLTDSGAYELHVVGQYVSAKRVQATRTSLVALGPADRISRDEIESWWQSARAVPA